MTSNAPNDVRSAGIAVALSQPPFAYPKKSSPGLMALSMPATSMPAALARKANGTFQNARFNSRTSASELKSRVLFIFKHVGIKALNLK
jgi:hypothetical protein